MYYILNPDVALRKYRRVPHCLIIRSQRDPINLSFEEFALLSFCDGHTDIQENYKLLKFKRLGYIKECKKDEFQLSDWQVRDCPNYLFPAAIIELTSGCNYNCKHCFNAMDNNPRHEFFTKEEIINLLDQMEMAGIQAITLTGGEPMLHPHFFEVVEEIYKRNMYLEELNTNGSFINDMALERLKEIGANPLIKISFDGLGHHDWMRGKDHAEEDTLHAVELCIKHGFRVKIQTNVWKANLDTLLETAEKMDQMGVEEMRIIRTTDVPRWLENGYGETLKTGEYYDAMLDLIGDYLKKPHEMDIDIWQFVRFSMKRKMYNIRAIAHGEGTYRDSYPRCQGCRGMVAIGANGNLYPCLQMSGTYDLDGINLGNVKREKLQDLLNDSKYFKEVSATVGELKEKNEKCRNCKYFKYCTGGCLALAYNAYRQTFKDDPWKCYFFEKEYYKKLDLLFKDYVSLTVMKPEEP